MIRKIYNMARQMNDVVDFTLGDPDIQTPDIVKFAGVSAIIENHTRYSENAGIYPLRNTIAEQISARAKMTVSASEVIVTVGAMAALFEALNIILANGGEVILCGPYWGNYKSMIQMCKGKEVIVDGEISDCYQPNIPLIKKSINENTRAIIINSPNNPTGYCVSAPVMQELVKIAKEHKMYLISDETYDEIIYGEKPSSILEYWAEYDRLVYVNSFSKFCNMTGWRCGYCVSSQDFIKKMTFAQENIAACAPVPSQYAALAAIVNKEQIVKQNIDIYKKRREIVCKRLSGISNLCWIASEATFYAFIDVSKTGMDGESFSLGLLEQERVAVVPGAAFGSAYRDYIRLSYTVKEDKLQKGFDRIQKFCQSI